MGHRRTHVGHCVLIILVIKWLFTSVIGDGDESCTSLVRRHTLGQNKSLQVVELSGRVYIVGVGDNITLLDKIDEPEEALAVMDAIEQQNSRTWNTPSLTNLDRHDSVNGILMLNRQVSLGRRLASFQELLMDKMKSAVGTANRRLKTLLKEQNHNRSVEWMMNKKLVLSLLALQLAGLLFHSHVFAADPLPNVIRLNIGDGSEQPGHKRAFLLLLITVLSVAPAILVLMTSFTRIVIVLGFVRTSLGTQQMPPNQVLIGLAMFLTFFIMAPTFSQVNTVSPSALSEGGNHPDSKRLVKQRSL